METQEWGISLPFYTLALFDAKEGFSVPTYPRESVDEVCVFGSFLGPIFQAEKGFEPPICGERIPGSTAGKSQ